MLPQLRAALADEILSRNLASQYMDSLQESLIRHIGTTEDKMDSAQCDLKNPVKWFRDGVRDVVALPAYLFGWLGLIREGSARKIVGSAYFSFISGVLALVSLLSCVVTIVVGWDAFIKGVEDLFF